MSTSLFFSQLKTFCYEAEQDAKKLRKQVDTKGEGKLALIVWSTRQGTNIPDIMIVCEYSWDSRLRISR